MEQLSMVLSIIIMTDLVCGEVHSVPTGQCCWQAYKSGVAKIKKWIHCMCCKNRHLNTCWKHSLLHFNDFQNNTFWLVILACDSSKHNSCNCNVHTSKQFIMDTCNWVRSTCHNAKQVGKHVYMHTYHKQMKMSLSEILNNIVTY